MSGLHVDSVVKSYGDRQILTDIYIACERGEVVGLLGRNGCGKSTLLKIIFGSLTAYSRFVKVDDVRIKGLADGCRHINYLPQDGFLPRHIKIKTAIGLFCHGPNYMAMVEHPLFKTMLNKKSGELSGGEQRFFEVMLMICSDVPFVLIDEPFNGIAPLYVEEIKRLIQENSGRKGFIITDHSYENILDIATRVVLIHDGAMRQISGREDLRYWGYIS